jgi:hypothetical protein
MATITKPKMKVSAAKAKATPVEEEEEVTTTVAKNGTAPKAAAVKAIAKAPAKAATAGSKIKTIEMEETEPEAIAALVKSITLVGKHFAAENVTITDHDKMKAAEFHLRLLRNIAWVQAHPTDPKGVPAVHSYYDKLLIARAKLVEA